MPDLQLSRVSHEAQGNEGEESGDGRPEETGAVREKEDGTRVELVQFHPRLDGASLVPLGLTFIARFSMTPPTTKVPFQAVHYDLLINPCPGPSCACSS